MKGRTVAAGKVSGLEGTGKVWLWDGRGIGGFRLADLPLPGKVPVLYGGLLKVDWPGKAGLGLLGTGGGTLPNGFSAD